MRNFVPLFSNSPTATRIVATESTKPYRIGVALSGGGARGFAHAGALKALEDAGYRPDVLAGVSAGSVAAVFYGAGVSPEGIVGAFAKSKFTDLCRVRITRRSGLDMSRFRAPVARTIAPFKSIEELPIPTYIGVTDFDSGTAVAFNHESIASNPHQKHPSEDK